MARFDHDDFSFARGDAAVTAARVIAASSVRPVLTGAVMGPAVAVGLSPVAVVVGVGVVTYGLFRLLGELFD